MPQSNWATQTGQDFTNHTLIKDIDFGGVHVWPDNWEMCAQRAAIRSTAGTSVDPVCCTHHSCT